MNSFYGNLKNNSRASFIFDKVYPNRYAMETAVLDGTDGVWVNRYVLIAYNYLFEDGKPPVVEDLSRYGFGGYVGNNPPDNATLEENPFFKNNREIDVLHYGAGYDKTVWMKIYSNQQEKYIQVGALNAAAPAFELIVDAPGEEDGRPHFDYYNSSELNYAYHMPKNWDMIMNHYSGNATDYTDDGVENADDYYYEDLIEENSTMRYPYVNSKGFNSKTRYYDYIIPDDITFTEVSSGEEYPGHEYVKIHLTVDTYVPNLYYHKIGGVWKIADEELFIPLIKGSYDPEKEYYTKALGKYVKVSDSEDFVYALNKYYYFDEETGLYLVSSTTEVTAGVDYYKYQNAKETSVLNDTKRLDVELPSIGNAISDVYDSIYGRPLVPGYPNGIKYIADLENYNSNFPNGYDENDYPNQCSIKGKYYFLSDTDWNNLSDAYSAETPIPVYNIANDEDRPYTQELLYNFLDIEPYNNVTPNDPVSMAWGVEELKRYISELRYLSHGEVDGNYDPLVYNGNGLQADWAIDDTGAFGYIYNKPMVVSHFIQVTEPKPVPLIFDDLYYYIRDVDDDKHVPYFLEGQVAGSGGQVLFMYNVYDEHDENVVTSTRNLALTRRDGNIGDTDYFNNFTQDVYLIADIISYYNFLEEPRYIVLNEEDFNKYRDGELSGLVYRFINARYEPISFDNPNAIPVFGTNWYYIKNSNLQITDTNTLIEANPYYFEIHLTEDTYLSNTYYIKNNENLYVLEGENSAFNFSTIYYILGIGYNTEAYTRDGSGVEFSSATMNNHYLGFNGKLIRTLILKPLNKNDITNSIASWDYLDLLNGPGGYDKYVLGMEFAKDKDGASIMDTTVIRDGRFHLYTNVRLINTGLAIERIWQRIPVEDIIDCETSFDVSDTEVVGDHGITIAESVEILDSPMSLLTNNVTLIANRTTKLENIVGALRYPEVLVSDTASLAARMNKAENDILNNAAGIEENTSVISVINETIGTTSSTTESTIFYRLNTAESSTTANALAIETLATDVGNNTSAILASTTAINDISTFVGTSASMTASYLENDTLASIIENLYIESHPTEPESNPEPEPENP